jgi:hypothetical protein
MERYAITPREGSGVENNPNEWFNNLSLHSGPTEVASVV